MSPGGGKILRKLMYGDGFFPDEPAVEVAQERPLQLSMFN